jgi:hypothetical protein
MTTTPDQTIGRPCDPMEIVRQIGRNVWAISGGRVGQYHDSRGTLCGVVLPVGCGYSVEVVLDASDTYTVRRVFARAGRRWVKAERSDVYADEVGEVAYRASCFRNDYPEGI